MCDRPAEKCSPHSTATPVPQLEKGISGAHIQVQSAEDKDLRSALRCTGTSSMHGRPWAVLPPRRSRGRQSATDYSVVFRRGYLRRSLQEPARQADVLSSTAATKELVQGKAVLPSKEADSEPGGLGIGL